MVLINKVADCGNLTDPGWQFKRNMDFAAAPSCYILKGVANMNTESPKNTNDENITKEVMKYSSGGELGCKQAFEAAEAMGVSPAAIGRCANEIGLKLVACRLGLFGYKPEKKIVRPAGVVPDDLETAIRGNLSDGRLPCIAAFEIAEHLAVKKMDVSGACEAMGISIKPCQLGAF